MQEILAEGFREQNLALGENLFYFGKPHSFLTRAQPKLFSML
jgi:hypothetical protein